MPACSLSGAIRVACSWWRGRLGRSGVTKPGSGALRVFARRSSCWAVTHVLWQGSCTGPHYGLSGDGLLWRWGLTGRGGSVGTSPPCSQRWMQHIKDRQGHRYVFIKKTLVTLQCDANPFYTHEVWGFQATFFIFEYESEGHFQSQRKGLKTTTNMSLLMISDKLLLLPGMRGI